MKLRIKELSLCVGGFAAGLSIIYVLMNQDNIAAADSKSKNGGKPTEVDWGTLRELDLRSGKASDALKNMDGTIIRVPGFIVPLEDSQNEVSDFLLVPSPQACVHVPAPPANQMVHVRMASGTKAKMSYGPVWAQGRIHIAETSGPYGKTSYEMVGEFTEPYK